MEPEPEPPPVGDALPPMVEAVVLEVVVVSVDEAAKVCSDCAIPLPRPVSGWMRVGLGILAGGMT